MEQALSLFHGCINESPFILYDCFRNPCFDQSKSIVLANLLPGKLFQAAIFPTIMSGKESKVPAKLELKSTCGCPVDEATLRRTEMTGMPTEIALTQVCY